MKKFLWIIVCLMAMVVSVSSCTTYEITANYDVCYPDGTRNYEVTDTVVYILRSEPSVACYSVFGTNYISIDKGKNVFSKNGVSKSIHLESSTSPMRLNNYSVKKLKKRKK